MQLPCRHWWMVRVGLIGCARFVPVSSCLTCLSGRWQAVVTETRAVGRQPADHAWRWRWMATAGVRASVADPIRVSSVRPASLIPGSYSIYSNRYMGTCAAASAGINIASHHAPSCINRPCTPKPVAQVCNLRGCLCMPLTSPGGSFLIIYVHGLAR